MPDREHYQSLYLTCELAIMLASEAPQRPVVTLTEESKL